MAKGRQGISFPLEVGVEGLALGVCGVCALGKDLNIFALGELNLAHAGPSLRHPPGLPTLYASLAISASGYPSSAGLAASCPSSDQQALCQGAFVSLKAASASPPPAFGPLLPQAPHGVGCLPSAPWTVGLGREQQ